MEKLQILHGILNYTELEIIKKQIRVIKDSYLFFDIDVCRANMDDDDLADLVGCGRWTKDFGSVYFYADNFGQPIQICRRRQAQSSLQSQ